MEPSRLDTAHEYWDQWWGDAKGRAIWSDPDGAVTGFMPRLHERSATAVLDVGTGIGRHALAYARDGFEVIATDASKTGLEQLETSARDHGLSIETHLAPFTELPLPDASVDHVLAWNVLYHGDGSLVLGAFIECRRVLRRGGTFQLTMLSKRNSAYGVGREIREDTFVDESSKGDKDHPHFYVDAAGLTRLLAQAGFEALALRDFDQRPVGAFHWEVIAETHTA
jgi:tellurite methyltransferase